MLCGWGVKAGMVYLQVKLCDPCLSALEVVTTIAIQIDVYFTTLPLLYFTDERTHDDSIYRASIASHGKKYLSSDVSTTE